MVFITSFLTPGSFCASPGLHAASGRCDAGYYCLSGARSATPVDAGVTGDRCPEGHYCPRGSSAPFPCPPGHYSNTTGNSHLSDCPPCPPGGKRRPPTASRRLCWCLTSSGGVCRVPVCHQGALVPLPRLSSWFLLSRRRSGSDSLLTWTHVPVWIPQTNQVSSWFLPEFTRPGETDPDERSGPTSVTPRGFPLPQAECAQCPGGFYCSALVDADGDRVSGTQTPVLCPEGHYCPPGGTSSHLMGVLWSQGTCTGHVGGTTVGRDDK